MAPNPQANPKPNAEKTALEGAAASTSCHAGIAGKTKVEGMITHATTINANQIFSHFQRFSIFIGVVKRPLQMPDKAASSIPMATISLFRNRFAKIY